MTTQLAADPQPIARVLNLIPDERQLLFGATVTEATRAVQSHDPHQVAALKGSFALTARDGELVLMARSLDRPMRYFLAKETDGPMLVVAERIDQIAECLADEGYQDQFEPSYTRMVPGHHITKLRLIGCPDPNPEHLRFVGARTGEAHSNAATEMTELGRSYVQAMADSVHYLIDSVDEREPIGVLFSGGIDSGSVLLAAYQAILDRGQAPQRLKAFTLSVNGGSDVNQAREFLAALDLEYLLEVIEVEPDAVDPLAAVEVIEDYKPLDVECAAVNLALLKEIRQRYPQWKWLLDGDGGDENLKDYPIEENGELTIRSVVNNPFLYQEGWGVEAIKHSLVYSGGYSRGCARTAAPLAHHGFSGLSPYASPEAVKASTAIPFRELAAGSHQRLYALKGELVAAGVRAVLGIDMPVFPKRRFQEGATGESLFVEDRKQAEQIYRQHFWRSYAA